jgi:hypothetical protein
LPSTSSTSRSKSTSLTLRPISSARRGPTSTRSRIRAVSRRSSKLLPPQVASSRRRPSSGTTGTGCSGTMGGFILAIGLAARRCRSKERSSGLRAVQSMCQKMAQ